MADKKPNLPVTLENGFHDLNNHLAAIAGFSTILVKALQGLPNEKEFASKILTAGEDAINLCDQLNIALKSYFDDGQ